ncbi:hypothetical protein NL676_011254 [Syzygium grande]|nr:hypothetical protein NL676_011254 [Syzygium grande]
MRDVHRKLAGRESAGGGGLKDARRRDSLWIEGRLEGGARMNLSRFLVRRYRAKRGASQPVVYNYATKERYVEEACRRRNAHTCRFVSVSPFDLSIPRKETVNSKTGSTREEEFFNSFSPSFRSSSFGAIEHLDFRDGRFPVARR